MVSYLLDEDVNPAVTVIATGLGLDVIGVHDLGRTGLSDEQQFEYAILGGRVLVTRNRDDHIDIARHYFSIGRTFPGLLVVPYSIPNVRPESIAHALKTWHTRYDEYPPDPATIDYLRPPVR